MKQPGSKFLPGSRPACYAEQYIQDPEGRGISENPNAFGRLKSWRSRRLTVID